VRLTLVIVILLVIALPVTLLVLSTGTNLKLDPPLTSVGMMTPVQVHIENPHGVRRLTAVIEQD
jgi:hypothetical protein